MKTTRNKNSCKKLLHAILNSALEDINIQPIELRGNDPLWRLNRNMNRERLRDEAWTWFNCGDTDDFTSFLNICSFIGTSNTEILYKVNLTYKEIKK